MAVLYVKHGLVIIVKPFMPYKIAKEPVSQHVLTAILPDLSPTLLLYCDVGKSCPPPLHANIYLLPLSTSPASLRLP